VSACLDTGVIGTVKGVIGTVKAMTYNKFLFSLMLCS